MGWGGGDEVLKILILDLKGPGDYRVKDLCRIQDVALRRRPPPLPVKGRQEDELVTRIKDPDVTAS